jgi:hypothetical protein
MSDRVPENKEEVQMLLEHWQAMERPSHTLSPCHPFKKYRRFLFDKIRRSKMSEDDLSKALAGEH